MGWARLREEGRRNKRRRKRSETQERRGGARLRLREGRGRRKKRRKLGKNAEKERIHTVERQMGARKYREDIKEYFKVNEEEEEKNEGIKIYVGRKWNKAKIGSSKGRNKRA